jgi:hypothetical protein
MSSGNKFQRFERYMLNHKLRSCGFELWRSIFCGISKTTGEERTFFIEFYLVNPSVSPKTAVIAQKSRLKMTESDLQYALAGTASALEINAEPDVQPSYVLVKAGAWGKSGKQVNQFFPASDCIWMKNDRTLHAGGCSMSEDTLTGSVSVSYAQLRESPEFLCNAGSIDWDLRYEKVVTQKPGYNHKKSVWFASAAKAVFAGVVHLDGEEYNVIPKSSFGYMDKAWSSRLSETYFHLSTVNLSSIITGKLLSKSSLAIQGEYDGRVNLLLCIEGKNLSITGHTPFDKYSEIHDCLQVPRDGDGEKLHWTVSFKKNSYVIDVDVFCRTSEMFIRDYEVPEAGRRLLKVLGGGSGTGEIRIYQKNGKNLEMLEHVHLADTVCEYGTIAQPEK